MARNSIGSLFVGLYADTRDFVQGMARSQASLDGVTRASTKTRQAVSQLGGAFRNPVLGRSGAFGGAASGVASALGLGALGGGAAGLAATGAFLLVDGLIERHKKIAELIKEQRTQSEALLQSQIEMGRASDQILNGLRNRGNTGPFAGDAQSLKVQEQVASLQAEVDALVSQLGSASGSPEVMRSLRTRINELREGIRTLNRDETRRLYETPPPTDTRQIEQEVIAQRAAERRAMAWESFQSRTDGRGPSGGMSIFETARALGERSLEYQRMLAEELAQFRRDYQRVSLPVATTVERLSAQLALLDNRR